MGQTGSVLFDVLSIYTKAFDLVNPASIALPYRKRIDFADGTGADQANLLFWDQRTLNASATEDLDLRGGLTDAFGASLSFVRVKVLYLFAALANTNNVLVGGAPSNGVTTFFSNVNDVAIVRPGGELAMVARDATAYTTTATTADLLRIANSGAGTPVTYDILLLGCDA